MFMEPTIHPDRFNRTLLVRGQTNHAFTLVELLVVMGTLALLAAAAWNLRKWMRESILFLASTGSAHRSHPNAYSFPARSLKSLSGPAIVVSNTTKRVVAPLTDKSHPGGLQSRHESGQEVAVSTAGVVSKPTNPETRNVGQIARA
jgi:prepilin-type N-terminal cleavage/methylation domain-containing protein